MMGAAYYFFGFVVGIFVGMQYIPHQLKKKDPKVIEKIKKLL